MDFVSIASSCKFVSHLEQKKPNSLKKKENKNSNTLGINSFVSPIKLRTKSHTDNKKRAISECNSNEHANRSDFFANNTKNDRNHLKTFERDRDIETKKQHLCLDWNLYLALVLMIHVLLFKHIPLAFEKRNK